MLNNHRAQFEAWATLELPGLDLCWHDEVNEYLIAGAHVAFKAWGASRCLALEDAAREAERIGGDADDAPRKPYEGYTEGYQDAGNDIAAAITELGEREF